MYQFNLNEVNGALVLTVLNSMGAIDSVFELTKRHRHDKAWLIAYAKRSIGLGYSRVSLSNNEGL